MTATRKTWPSTSSAVTCVGSPARRRRQGRPGNGIIFLATSRLLRWPSLGDGCFDPFGAGLERQPEVSQVSQISNARFARGDVDDDIEDPIASGRQGISDNMKAVLKAARGQERRNSFEKGAIDEALLVKPGNGRATLRVDPVARGTNRLGERWVDAGHAGQNGRGSGIDVDDVLLACFARAREKIERKRQIGRASCRER